MPELPEVQTTVNGLNKTILGKTFVDVWSDWPKTVKKPKDFSDFKKTIRNKKITKIWRRAKNIIIDLSGGHSLLIHLKMTGHLLVGEWIRKDNIWRPKDKKSPLNDPYNRFLHNIFFLDNGQMLAMSDARKFGKIELWSTDELLGSKDLKDLGPEPLDEKFTLADFKKVIKKKKGKVKEVIMIPQVIAGVGNIYASEALWEAKIHPLKKTDNLTNREIKSLYGAIKKVLKLGVDLGGGSFSDYRKIDGTKGDFIEASRAYQREDEPCHRCKTKLKRIKHGGRSTFFCPKCQRM